MTEDNAPIAAASANPADAPVAPPVPPDAVAAQPAPRPRPSWVRPLVLISAFVVLLTVASTAAVIVAGNPARATYGSGTPQAAFQSFVDAAQSGDWSTADKYVSENQHAMGATAQSLAIGISTGTWTITIQDTTGTGDRVTLFVNYQMASSGGVLNTTTSFTGSVQMVRESDGWKIDSNLFGQSY